jgi:hypothetical protein
LDISDGSNGLITLSPPVLDQITNIYGAADRVYVLGTDSSGYGGIVYYDTVADTWTTILTPGEYTVSQMEVNLSGEVLFYGTRNSDSSNVIGKILGSGAIEIISEGTNINVKSIIRITS